MGPKVLNTFKILTLEKLYRSKLASFMWDFHHGLLPSHLQEFFKYSSEFHGYGTRSSTNANLAQNISCKTKVGSLMVKFTGPKVLNTLKNLSFCNLRRTKNSFISKYKNYLLDSPKQYTLWQHQYFISYNNSFILFSIIILSSIHLCVSLHHLNPSSHNLHLSSISVFTYCIPCFSNSLFYSTMQLFFGAKCFIYFSHIILMA